MSKKRQVIYETREFLGEEAEAVDLIRKYWDFISNDGGGGLDLRIYRPPFEYFIKSLYEKDMASIAHDLCYLYLILYQPDVEQDSLSGEEVTS